MTTSAVPVNPQSLDLLQLCNIQANSFLKSWPRGYKSFADFIYLKAHMFRME